MTRRTEATATMTCPLRCAGRTSAVRTNIMDQIM